jgi:hypothetical protein
MLHSPLGFKYNCVYIYNYISSDNTQRIINGTFYVGNPKTKPEEACITISVFYPSDQSFPDSSIASLILVKHYEACSENKRLPKGEGTVDMMYTAMSFVKQVCKFIREFKLNDASTKQCDNGSMITLPYFYITQKGKTWYEGRFGAYLKEPMYTEYKNTVEKVMNYKLPDFIEFYMRYIQSTNTPQHVVDEIKKVYVPGNTIHEFFRHLYANYSVSIGCILLQPWIDTFMKIVGLHIYILKHEWYISINQIPEYQFKNINKSYRTNTFTNTRKLRPWNS